LAKEGGEESNENQTREDISQERSHRILLSAKEKISTFVAAAKSLPGKALPYYWQTWVTDLSRYDLSLRESVSDASAQTGVGKVHGVNRFIHSHNQYKRITLKIKRNRIALAKWKWPAGVRLQFLEQNVYFGPQTADEYLWFYSESVNWRRERVPAEKAWGPQSGFPKDALQAIESARCKIDQGKPLGFDIAPIVNRGWEAAGKAYEERKKQTAQ
jgi:hypothetical protein